MVLLYEVTNHPSCPTPYVPGSVESLSTRIENFPHSGPSLYMYRRCAIHVDPIASKVHGNWSGYVLYTLDDAGNASGRLLYYEEQGGP